MKRQMNTNTKRKMDETDEIKKMFPFLSCSQICNLTSCLEEDGRGLEERNGEEEEARDQ